MGMIKLKNILNEIGDASVAPYPFTRVNSDIGKNIKYNFDTPTEKYWVKFAPDTGTHKFLPHYAKNNPPWKYEVIFSTYEGMPNDTTDRGEMYAVMSTISDIVKDFVNRFTNARELVIIPTKDSAKKDWTKDRRRFKLYLAYIDKQLEKSLPGADINISKMYVDDVITISIPRLGD